MSLGYQINSRARKNLIQKKYFERNRELCLARSKAWKDNNKERVKEYDHEKYWSDPEKKNKYSKMRYWLNVDKNRARVLKWCKDNPDRASANAMRRRARFLMRIPKWSYPEDILPFYSIAKMMTKHTGIKYEVDHIYPLLGETVSGLHVASNLRVITKSENCKKGNKVICL